MAGRVFAPQVSIVAPTVYGVDRNVGAFNVVDLYALLEEKAMPVPVVRWETNQPSIFGVPLNNPGGPLVRGNMVRGTTQAYSVAPLMSSARTHTNRSSRTSGESQSDLIFT